MSQQRQCCCGEEQEFGHECLATDKIFPAGTNANQAPTKGQGDYKQAPHGKGSFIENGIQMFYSNRGTIQAESSKRARMPNRFQSVENDVAFNSVKTRERLNTTGMGCMLQHGTLIMSTKLLKNRVREFGRSQTICNQTNCAAADYHFGSISRSTFVPEEPEQHIMYNAYKDYWYLQLGPAGFPYSFRSNRAPYNQALGPYNGKFYNPTGLGIRSSGSDVASFLPDCALYPQHRPTLTDADLMCYPDLTAMTNPANVWFGKRNQDTGAFISVGDQGKMTSSIRAAYDTWQKGVDNNEPELANHKTNDDIPGSSVTGQWLCTNMESNQNPWLVVYGQSRAPCYGSFMPGVSSWQAYICRSQAEYRLLGDTMSFGNGSPVFTSPSSILDLKEGQSDIAFAPLQNAMLGTLHRVRLWVRSDMVTIKDRFPCEDGNGEIHSHYPPETNRRMRASGPTQNSPNNSGYSVTKKLCGSGPASLMYACSGVPIFTSDYEMMRQRDTEADQQADSTGLIDVLEKLYYGDWDPNAAGGPYGGIYDEQTAKCVFDVGQIEESLGKTGLYAAKDWRQDQLNKWDTLADKFKTISEQNKTNPDLTEEQRVALESYASQEFTGVPERFKNRIKPSGDIELLPAQKFGEQMLSIFITRAKPKQLAGDETAGTTLLSEMAYYQSTEFDGENFAIDSIDPWHKENTGTSSWKPLGRNRIDPFTGLVMNLTLQNPGGNDVDVPIYYPIRSLFDTWREIRGLPPFTDSEFDQAVPGWEQELWKAWWTSNPIYFHATPGGWAWAGDGQGNTVAKNANGFNIDQCRWGSQPKKLTNLTHVSQLEWYTTNRALLYCPGGLGETWPVITYQIPAIGGGGLISTGVQLRNRPVSRACPMMSVNCFLDARDSSDWFPCGGICDCVATRRCGGWVAGSGQCTTGLCAGKRQVDGYQIYNCCDNYTPYGNRSAGRGPLRGKATAGIYDQNPINVDTGSMSSTEYRSWNRNNPEVSLKDGALYGARCTEQGNCPPGFECCCAGGCGGNCFCVPIGGACETKPCSSSNDFRSECCTTFGSCCYEAEDGLIRCENDVTKEQCIARKEHGGFNGTFTEDVTCEEFPCRTDGVTGACFYVDPLLDHQICRETTSNTCSDLGGEFFANQSCTDITGKITTGYESKLNTVGVKPPAPGDRTCGQFGFSVNCCTKTTDPATGAEVYTCETKCMSDCDHGKGGSATIVQTCEACGELGHCCTMNGMCEANVTRESCTGTWFPGAGCDERSCEIPETENYLNTNLFGGMPGRRPYAAGNVGTLDGAEKPYDPKLYNYPYSLPTGKIPAYDPEVDKPAKPVTDAFGYAAISSSQPSVESDNTSQTVTGLDIPKLNYGPFTDDGTGRDSGGGKIPFPSPRQRAGGLGGDGGAGGGGGGGGSCSDPCANPIPTATFDVCLPSANYFSDLAAEYVPYPPDNSAGLDPGFCNVRPNQSAFRSCLIRQVQAVRTGLRYVMFLARQDSDGFDSQCPVGDTTFSCCEYRCNPALYHSSALICESEAEPLGDWTLHRDQASLVSHVYPFRIRCKQTRDESGLYRCAIQTQATPVPEADLARGIIGVSDLLTCHYRQVRRQGAKSSLYTCTSYGYGCSDDKPRAQTCEETVSMDTYTKWSGAEWKGGYRPYLPHVNPGGACVNIQDTLTAKSIAFPNDDVASEHLYAPSYGIAGIPKQNCPSSYIEKPLNSIPGQLPMGTLGQCAEFYNDKLLSDFEDDGLPEIPEPTTFLRFHDYGGLQGTYEDNRTGEDVPLQSDPGIPGAGVGSQQIQSEFVDANWNGDQNDPTFWIYQEFPTLKYVRFFSAGCFRLPGSFHGGQSETITLDDGLPTETVVGGGYAGTLVVVFGSTDEFQQFDEYYGSENLKLSFATPPPGYENVGQENSVINPKITDQDIFFVGRPSFNIRTVQDINSDEGGGGAGGNQGENEGPEQDLSYESVGYINGYGLTYANVNNNETGPAIGKVYEFCVPFGKNTAHVGQLKPIFTPGETIPEFSGLRGPIALFGQSTDDNGGKFLTKLERFTDRITTDETLGTCYRSWIGSPGLPPGCDDGGDNEPPGPGAPGSGGGARLSGLCQLDEIISEDAYEGSETFELPAGASDTDYCFYNGSTLEDSQEIFDDDGNSIGYNIVWDRAWFPDLAGITDGGSVGCCNQSEENTDINCTTWEEGEAGLNAGENVYRRANTSSDCREAIGP